MGIKVIINEEEPIENTLRRFAMIEFHSLALTYIIHNSIKIQAICKPKWSFNGFAL